MATIKKKPSKRDQYRRMLESLEREFYGGNYDDWECGNTMGLYVRNPWKCRNIFDKFNAVKGQK